MRRQPKTDRCSHRHRRTGLTPVLAGILAALTVASGLIVVLALSWHATESAPIPKVAPEDEEFSASLFMVGDALIHDTVYNYAATGERDENGLMRYDFTPMLAEIAPIASQYDLEYYNQETVLGGTALGLSSYPAFNSPFEVGDAFRAAGFNLVSLATNHTMDRGVAGVENSLGYWRQFADEVYYDGSAGSFAERDAVDIREVNGISYAFFSYTMWNNGLATPAGQEYLNNEWNEELAAAQIGAVRSDVDVVIVAMHWGTEYSHTPSAAQVQTAEFLNSLGVDIIIGAHPHVVQPIDVIGSAVASGTDCGCICNCADGENCVGADCANDKNCTGDNCENCADSGCEACGEDENCAGDCENCAGNGCENCMTSQNLGWVEDGEKKTLVIYSLGNFISDQAGTERLTGLMASTRITKSATYTLDGDTVVGKSTISIAPAHAELIYTAKNTAARTITVYPYSRLDNSLLPGFADYQIELGAIVTRYGRAELVEMATDEYGG